MAEVSPGGRPDPGAARTVADFIQQLRLLKVWAGDPSLRDLSRRTGLPRSTIADALHPVRARLPALDLVRALVRACGAERDLPRWERAWRAVRAVGDGLTDLGMRPVAVPAELPPDVAAFTGRDAALAALDAHLDHVDGVPAVVICAVSGTAGVGKPKARS